MSEFMPFENDVQSTNVGPGEGLTFENGIDEINIYGDFSIDKNTNVEEINSLIEVFDKIKNQLLVLKMENQSNQSSQSPRPEGRGL